MHPAIPIGFVFIGCCLNNIFLELLVIECPSSGNIITVSQFVFIAVEGFLFQTNFGTKQRAIPMTTYAVMVLMFALQSIVNNYALNFNISMPLHMIFRAGSLMANLVLGVIILKARYSITKYISVLMISVGISLATIASAQHMRHSSNNSTNNTGHADQNSEQVDQLTDFVRWLIGIAMLTFALFLSARMGIYQETVYTRFGKHPSEALFYNHALPIPFFIFFYSDLYKHVQLFNQSDVISVPMLAMLPAVPKMWLYLLGNVVTQYICIKSVFVLTTECTSLTVTLVVTLRKFVSLLISIAYFHNPFTLYHWLGTVLVFGGTLLFTGVLSAAWACSRDLLSRVATSKSVKKKKLN